MEVKTSNVVMESSEQLQEKQFTIATNAKAFEILTSTLYKNVPSSIVRELISNGYDGHIRAGNVDKEIEVHAPSVFEPTFEVRDFGCSMDEETMMNVYTTFFSSTKNADNNEVGGFGLGCKLPFAYTDMFTITTYLNGKQQDYIASKNNGVPTLSKFGDATDTSEPNGVKVCVPVQEDDIDAFCGAVKYMVRYSKFKIKSNLECEAVKEYDNFGLTNFHNYGKVAEEGRCLKWKQIIRVGGVPYDFDESTMKQDFIGWKDVRDYKLENTYEGGGALLHEALAECNDTEFLECTMSQLFNFNGCLDFEVGELDITASRESLQYSKKTRKALFKRLVELQTTLSKHLIKLLDKWNNNVGTFKEALEKLEYFKQIQWGAFYFVVRNRPFKYKCGRYENKIDLDSFNVSLVCYGEQVLKDNDLLKGLFTPKLHTLNGDTKRIQHSAKLMTFNPCKGLKQIEVFLTNAPLKYSGISISQEEVDLLGRGSACKAIISVSSRSNVKEQGEWLQKQFDEICPDLYKVITVDKKDCFIPKAEKERNGKSVVVVAEDERPMTIAAKELIEQMKPISDCFGKIYLFKSNTIQYQIQRVLDSLVMAKDLTGIPDLTPILECVKIHGTARKMVEKYTDIPVVFFEDEMENDRNGDVVFRHELFRKLKHALQKICFFTSIDPDMAKLGKAIVKYGKDLNVNMNTLEVMSRYKEIPFPSLYMSEFGMNNEHVQEVWAIVCQNCLNRLDTEQRFKLLAQIFLCRSFYYPNQLFKNLIANFGLTANN